MSATHKVEEGKGKNKDFALLVDERLAEINNSMATLTGRVDDIEKRIEELESMAPLRSLVERYN